MMKEFNLQGRNDKAIFDYLNDSYQLQENFVKNSTESIKEQESILKPLYIKFAKKCIEEYCRLYSLLPSMTIALRNELDNDEDSEIFINALNANISRINTAVYSLFEDAEASLQDLAINSQ